MHYNIWIMDGLDVISVFLLCDVLISTKYVYFLQSNEMSPFGIDRNLVGLRDSSVVGLSYFSLIIFGRYTYIFCGFMRCDCKYIHIAIRY